MQFGTANPSSGIGGKGSLDGYEVHWWGGVTNEANAAQNGALDLIKVAAEIETEGDERFERAGKETFAACFVDRRFRGIDDHDAQTFTSGGDGAGEASRTCSYDEDVVMNGATMHSVLCILTLFLQWNLCVDEQMTNTLREFDEDRLAGAVAL